MDKEEQHVHQVYQEIASHFSNTRYKPWPLVEKFLKGQESGSIGLDVGCGNGKYVGVNESVYIMACDRSSELVNIASEQKCDGKKFGDAGVADGLDLPYVPNRFDFIISIAVVHHFSTPERRVQALSTILEKLKVQGQAMIYVWALEQKNSRRGWDAGMEQDVMVPWVLQGSNETKYRYYHLYKQGELEDDATKAGGEVVESGYERDNWWIIMKKKES